MGASKRGFRSILSLKKNYDHLEEDETDFRLAKISVLNSDPVPVSSVTPIVAEAEAEEEKVADTGDEGVLESTRTAAIEFVRRTSSMTDLVAKRMALSRSFPDPSEIHEAVADATTAPVMEEEEEKVAEPESFEAQSSDNGEDIVQEEINQKVQDCYRCGNELVASGKENTNNLVEASITLGKNLMASAEACSQAAFANRLPLSPRLEQTSEKMEKAATEVQEFFLEHWALLKGLIAKLHQPTESPSPPSTPAPEATANAESSSSTSGSVGNNEKVPDAEVSVSIEVHMKDDEC